MNVRLLNKRLLVYAGALVAVAAAFGIASNGMFPDAADVSEAKDACDDGTFDGVASPLGPGQMRAEDCYMLGVLAMAKVSVWLVQMAVIIAAVTFGYIWIIRMIDAKSPNI